MYRPLYYPTQAETLNFSCKTALNLMGVSENRDSLFSTLDSRIRLIRSPKQGTPHFRKHPYATSQAASRAQRAACAGLPLPRLSTLSLGQGLRVNIRIVESIRLWRLKDATPWLRILPSEYRTPSRIIHDASVPKPQTLPTCNSTTSSPQDVDVMKRKRCEVIVQFLDPPTTL